MAVPDGVRVRELVHEINNTLGIVVTYSSLVLEAVDDRPQAKADVTEIRQAALRTVELIGQLAALLRGEDQAT